jgi:hypothetical protein
VRALELTGGALQNAARLQLLRQGRQFDTAAEPLVLLRKRDCRRWAAG